MGISTAFNSLKDFSNAVITVLLPVHIRVSDEKMLACPCVKNVGVPLDESHIPIISPEYASDYCDQKVVAGSCGWQRAFAAMYVWAIQEVFMMPEYSDSQICGTC